MSTNDTFTPCSKCQNQYDFLKSENLNLIKKNEEINTKLNEIKELTGATLDDKIAEFDEILKKINKPNNNVSIIPSDSNFATKIINLEKKVQDEINLKNEKELLVNSLKNQLSQIQSEFQDVINDMKDKHYKDLQFKDEKIKAISKEDQLIERDQDSSIELLKLKLSKIQFDYETEKERNKQLLSQIANNESQNVTNLQKKQKEISDLNNKLRDSSLNGHKLLVNSETLYSENFDLKQEIQKLKIEKDKMLKSSVGLSDEIKTIKENVVRKKDDLFVENEELSKEVYELRRKCAICEEEIQGFRRSVEEDVMTTAKEWKLKFDRISGEKNDLNEEITRLRHRLLSLQTSIQPLQIQSSQCNHCNHPYTKPTNTVDSETYESLSKRYRALSSQIASYEDAETRLKKELENKDTEINKYQNEIINLENIIKNLQSLNNECVDKMEEINTRGKREHDHCKLIKLKAKKKIDELKSSVEKLTIKNSELSSLNRAIITETHHTSKTTASPMLPVVEMSRSRILKV